VLKAVIVISITFFLFKVILPFTLKIHELYELHHTRFPEDVNAYLDHVAFCKDYKEHRRASCIFKKLLAFHGNLPELWVVAAMNELERHDVEAARALMQRCVSSNPASRLGWVEFFRMELQIARMGPDPSPDLADLIAHAALEELPGDLDLLLDLLEVSAAFDFYKPQRQVLFQQLKEEYAHTPLVCDFRARLSLPDRKHKLKKLSEKDESKFIAAYECEVVEMPSQEMWSLYIKACLGLVSVAKDDDDDVFSKRLANVLTLFQRACDQQLLEHDLFAVWVRLLLDVQGQMTEVDQVSQVMVQRFPTSVNAWKLRLSILFQTLASAASVTSCLDKALSSVPESESWCLWEGVLQYLNASDSDKMEHLLQRACERPVREVCMPAKRLALQWAALNKDIKAVRELYKKLSAIKPVPLDFYLQYAQLELKHEKLNLKKVRRAFEDAVTDYGKTEPNLWLEYIRMEMSAAGGDPAQAGNLHLRASLNLASDALKHAFLQEFDAIVCGAGRSQ
jgi:U3 small nucleolar RNA-associated protein 6